MLNGSFVPVAVDINVVMNQKDAEGDFFRNIAEQGHYAGVTKPTATRQGLYITGVDADLLRSMNTTDAQEVIGLMSRGLASWESKNPNKIKAFAQSNDPDSNYFAEFPSGGLILRETMRDLPRTSVYRQPTDRHNFDHVWLSKEEVDSLVPEDVKEGQTWQIADSISKRLVQFHMVDQVKGEADAWAHDDVKTSEISAKVTKIQDDTVTIQLSGKAKCQKPASGKKNPYNGQRIRVEQTIDLNIQGWITFDASDKQITKFELLAAGPRTGGALYNFRWDDMGPEPIGFAFEMLADKPQNRIRPKFIHWGYWGSE